MSGTDTIVHLNRDTGARIAAEHQALPLPGCFGLCGSPNETNQTNRAVSFAHPLRSQIFILVVHGGPCSKRSHW